MTPHASFGLGVIAGMAICWVLPRVGDWIAAWVRRRKR